MGTGANTKERILEAALETFAQYGYEGAKMEKIASLVGINKASLYFHFKSKEELFRDLFKTIVYKFSIAIKNIVLDTKNLPTKLRLITIYEKYLEYNWNNNVEMDLWNGIYYFPPETMKEEILKTTSETKEQFLKDLVGVFEEGIRNNEIQAWSTLAMAKTYYYLLTCIDLSVDILNKEEGLSDMKNGFEIFWNGIIK